MGGDNVIGEETGEETVTILITQYPAHVHAFNVYNTFGLAGQPTNAPLSGRDQGQLATAAATPGAPAATAGGRAEPLRPPRRDDAADPCGAGRIPRREPAARQSPALPRHELQHRPDGRFPVEELSASGRVSDVRGEKSNVH